MKKIKSVAAVAAVVALGVTTVGCSDQSNSTEEASGEITYAIWSENQAPTMQQIIDDFEQEHPEIQVSLEITPFAQYWTKLQTQATSDTLPDVFWMNGPHVQLYANNGKLADVSTLESDGLIDLADYPEAMNELYTVDGVQYAVPKDFDTVALWYNAALFEEAGVDLPTEDWTWDEFTTAAAQITDALGDQGVYGTVAELLSLGQGSYYNSILQAGGEVISDDSTTSGFDSPEAIRGLQLWADLIASGDMPTIEQLSDTAATTWFESGRAAMFWSGTWSVLPISESEVAEDVNVVPLPSDERRATVIHGIGNAMSASTDNSAAASVFLAYLGSEQANLTQAETGAANPAFLGTQDAYVEAHPEFDLQVFEDAAEEYAYPYPASGNTAAWNDLETSLLPDAFSGARPVDEVAEELAEQMNQLLEQE